MKNLTQADVVRLFEDAGLTIDICGSLRVTHKTGTFLYDTEDEDDRGVYIAMHQDTIDADNARGVAHLDRVGGYQDRGADDPRPRAGGTHINQRNQPNEKPNESRCRPPF